MKLDVWTINTINLLSIEFKKTHPEGTVDEFIKWLYTDLKKKKGHGYEPHPLLDKFTISKFRSFVKSYPHLSKKWLT